MQQLSPAAAAAAAATVTLSTCQGWCVGALCCWCELHCTASELQRWIVPADGEHNQRSFAAATSNSWVLCQQGMEVHTSRNHTVAYA
jgi:hypothetical protein